MSEYIDREALKNDIATNTEPFNTGSVLRAINRQPAADVIPRPRWIPVTERLPEPETEVMIVCNENGRRFIATAIHEDGTQLSEESCWVWTDIWEYSRYDEEHEIISSRRAGGRAAASRRTMFTTAW